jgi:DNA-binding NarL/FixJ family response regulator
MPQASLPTYRVLIVEDDPQTLAFFAQSVRSNTQLQLCGEAASLAQARSLLQSLKDSQQSPDVLLTDLGLPDGSGLQLIEQVARELPGCDSLVISMFGDEDHVLASIEAGATGYIHKDSAPADIAQSILLLKSGASPISPMIARRLLAKYRSISQQTQPAAAPSPNFDHLSPVPGTKPRVLAIKNVANTHSQDTSTLAHTPPSARVLSEREIEILELIAKGYSYAEVARGIFLSVHTVQTHIKNIYGKLRVHNRSEAVYEATRLGLLKPQ